MEETGVMSEEAWSSLSGMYTSKDESEILSQFLSGFSCPNELSEIWPSDKEPDSLVCSSDFCNSNECLASQETSILSPDDGQSVLYRDGSFYHRDDVSEGFERTRLFSQMSCFGEDELERFDFAGRPVYLFPTAGEPLLKSYNLGGFSDQYDISDIGELEKQELDVDQPLQRDLPNADANTYTPESKKRSRNATDVTRSKRNMKSEKYQKVVVPENAATKNDESNAVITKKSSASHSSEEHSSITHEVTEGETNTSKTTKGKSGKGASSDPQSLYARKRRERINERLRILQGLVPNGTKVDISTMLEEAVHYVKFLQLQIKLLSSDDTWMYAPLAYNGMDIGIGNIDITTNTSPR